MPDSTELDLSLVSQALELALQPVSAPHPNPRVGCVIAKGERVIGRGFHRAAGQPHAEVEALNSCDVSPAGATMYVTLEPCTHFGRTPPCVDQVIESGIERVVICTEDPNPAVRGRGVDKLRQAGIRTEVGLLHEQGRSVNRGFFSRHETGRAWVTVKVAATLDGRTATASGESKWITCRESRQDVQRLRAQASAILTGIGTVLADNPRLNCRAQNAGRCPARVIVDSSLAISPDMRLFDHDGEVIVAVKQGIAAKRRSRLGKSADIIELPPGPGGVDCETLLKHLADREFNEILVEAGPRLVGSLLAGGLVDEMIVYMSPSMIGDRGRGMAVMPGIERLSDRIHAKFTEFRQLGDDYRIRFSLERNN